MENTNTERCRNRDTLTTGAAFGGDRAANLLDVNDNSRDAWAVFLAFETGKKLGFSGLSLPEGDNQASGHDEPAARVDGQGGGR